MCPGCANIVEVNPRPASSSVVIIPGRWDLLAIATPDNVKSLGLAGCRELRERINEAIYDLERGRTTPGIAG